MNERIIAGLLCAILTMGAAVAAPVPGVEHIVVVGMDGMTASSFNRAKTPNMHEVMTRGAYTLHARSVDPSVSSPNWASIIMGAKPETHGITSNDWKPGDTPAFVTIFGLCRTMQPAGDVAAIYEWGGFGNLYHKTDVTYDANPGSGLWAKYVQGQSNAYAAASATAARIREKKPLFSFTQLDLVDHAGHSEGYDTPKYDLAVGTADAHLGQIVQAIRDAGVQDTTVLFVIADHGGKGTGHGGKSDEETTVPWMVMGPGIAENREIKEAVGVAQTAPTIALLFGLTPPEKWTEQAVSQILK